MKCILVKKIIINSKPKKYYCIKYTKKVFILIWYEIRGPTVSVGGRWYQVGTIHASAESHALHSIFFYDLITTYRIK